MQLLRRPIASYTRGIVRLPLILVQFVRAVRLVRKPHRYLTSYLLAKAPSIPTIEFRDGLRVSLSSHPSDLVTSFVVFVKRDYGEIPAGGTVLDIGANIGCFSLYAARAGARRIVAVEPSAEAYSTLVENIRQNALARLVQPVQMAVTGDAGAVVPFPTRSSPESRIGVADATHEVSYVRTTTIEELLTTFAVEEVDLLKLDCEGAEYDIIFKTPGYLWSVVKRIRLEYHAGRSLELIAYLRGHGYGVRRHRARQVETSEHGDLWVERT